MAHETLVGRNYTTPDLVAKVTGRAKYAEDYRADGMLFTKLLLSQMPHARVRRIDASAALAMPGVKAIATADDLPDLRGAERALTNEPLYQGEPILAVAAVDEAAAAEAIERITVDLEPLPFVVDPVESLRPAGANGRLEGNVWLTPPGPPAPGAQPARPKLQTLKWTEDDFANAPEGGLPMGKAPEEWSYGDLDAGFKDAVLVLDETFVVPSTSHQPMESRSAMAYWQNGKLYLHGSTQIVVRTVDPLATWLGIDAKNIVLISEYCGGGFGSKGAGAVSMVIPAVLSKKTGTPVMMRISREEEHYIGRARTGMTGRARVGFRKDGRITALDLFIVEDNGPYGPMGDHRSAGNAASLIWQPLAMRWRGVAVVTNTPPRSQQRSPGPMQANAIMEPIVTKAAKKLRLDQVAIRRINSPEGKALYGAPRSNGQRPHTTSAYVKQALDRGVELFKWDERKARAGKRQGTKVRGLGVAVGPHGSGSIAVGNERVYRRDNPSRGLTFAQAAKCAIELGGRYDGHELPDDIHPFTRRSAASLAGLGLMGVAKDNYPHDGDTWSFVAGFAEVEVDIETGQATLIDYLAVADVGTVINPRSLHGQILGGINLGIGHALTQRWVYDQHYGVPLAKRFHHNRPLTILDIPATMHTDAIGLADPETPVGARGVGEPPVGAGYGAVLNAIADAVGEDAFRRAPVTADIVLTSLEHGRRVHEMTAHI